MHIAASSPVCVSRDEVPADLVAKEKEIATGQAAGKPAAAIEKMVAGKLEKFFAQSALLEQPFVKNPDTTVKALVEATAKQASDSITVVGFTRLQVGA
jgi:elongation factor Ts